MKVDVAKYNPAMREELMQQVQMQMSEKRFVHVLGVEEMAVALAKKYGADPNKASIAALCHDYAKERSDDDFIFEIERKQLTPALLKWNNAIWHGVVGAEFVCDELGVEDEEILQAIRVHTTGSREMSLLDKVIFVADYVEKNRQFPGVEEARELAISDLDAAVRYELTHTLQFLISKGQAIHPKTIETYNYYVAKH